MGLAVLGAYLFFDSVLVSTGQHGLFSGWMFGGGSGFGGWQTASAGILFIPFFLGVVSLFFDSRLKWAWELMWIGLAIIAIEILSRVRFQMSMKTTYLLIVIGLFGAGVGLMIRSYRETSHRSDTFAQDTNSKKPPPI